MANNLGVRGTGGPAGPARGTGKDVSQREDLANFITMITRDETCLLYTSPSPRDRTRSRMPSSA